MGETSIPGFSFESVLRAQDALRRTLGRSNDQIPLSEVLELLSDEIEALRAAGRSDAEIASLISEAANRALLVEDLAAFHPPPR